MVAAIGLLATSLFAAGPAESNSLRDQFEEAVRTGGTVTIEALDTTTNLETQTLRLLPPERHTFELAPTNSRLLEDTVLMAGVNPAKDAPEIVVWEGIADGDVTRPFRVITTDDWVRVIVWYDDDLWVHDAGTQKHEAVAIPSTVDGGRSPDPGCPETDPARAPGQPRGRFAGSRLTATVAAEASPNVTAALGRDTWGWMASTMATADLIYDHEVGVRLEVSSLGIADRRYDAALASRSTMFEEMRKRFEGGPQDAAFLFIDQVNDYAAAMVDCIGGVGDPSLGLAYISIAPAAGWSVDVDKEATTAHELGHLFGAEHDDGNTQEGDGGTLMQGLPQGMRDTIFSTITRPVIRATAEARLS